MTDSRVEAAELGDTEGRVATQGEGLTVGDYLAACVMERTMHHLDLVAHLPGVAGPPAERVELGALVA